MAEVRLEQEQVDLLIYIITSYFDTFLCGLDPISKAYVSGDQILTAAWFKKSPGDHLQTLIEERRTQHLEDLTDCLATLTYLSTASGPRYSFDTRMVSLIEQVLPFAKVFFGEKKFQKKIQTLYDVFSPHSSLL